MELNQTRTSLSRRGFLASALAGGVWLGFGGLGGGLQARAYALEAAPLEILERVPLNAQPRPAALVQSWITPESQFYIRTNGNVPEISADSYRLRIQGLVERPLELSLAQLREDFPRVDLLATLQCAGNRRTEMAAEKAIEGTPWGSTALGNANWTGVRLADVLKAAGMSPEAAHVWLTGRDSCEVKGEMLNFGGTLPLDKALRPETILAYAMNGEPLTPIHGAPLRALIPGFIGARSVKWLDTIEVADRPSENYFVAKSYKIFPPEVDSKNVDWNAQPPLYELPLNAAISTPAAGTQLSGGIARVEGWAFAGGLPQAQLARVEVSTDEGATWQEAAFTSPEAPFCWRLWRAEVRLSSATSSLLARATNTDGAQQPEDAPWNFKGYHHNAWHRVPVQVI